MDLWKRRKYAVFYLLWLMSLVLGGQGAQADESAYSVQGEETMLMFVGEDVEILSIASRREESAFQSPAIAQVYTRKQIRERGFATLGQVLETSPGFYIAGKEWGAQPYLRGIPDSVLFLYDTVPIGSDTRKNFNPLSYEFSLTDVKRVEIIRGPGSVLWGPDAFGGIVNIVPLSGRDIDGLETGITYNCQEKAEGFYLNTGFDNGFVDGVFSISSREESAGDSGEHLIHFWGDGDIAVPPDQRTGGEAFGSSNFVEASTRLSFGEGLKVTARMADNEKSYPMETQGGEYQWIESRGAPSRLVKVEVHRKLDMFSAVRLTGTYTSLEQTHDIIDTELSQEEETAYGECIFDRSFLSGTGLLTTGVSYREKNVRDAPIWDGYLPEYITPANPFLLPIITLEDYGAELWSAFSQYHQRFGPLSAWVGARNDNHGDYRDHASWNAGTLWSPREEWVFKVLYGTAYRTPYARQLLEEGKPELEKIRSLNLQVGWQPSKAARIALSGFASAIENHLMEDPYAGLSRPNTQDFIGSECEIFYSIREDLDVNANVTVFKNSGSDETYAYNYATFIRPDGTVERLYRDLSYPFDSGAETMANMALTYRPLDWLTVCGGLRYFAERKLVFPMGGEVEECPDVWLADMNIELPDMPVRKSTLTIGARNLFDESYRTPGTYNTIQGEPLTLTFGWRMRW